MIKVDIFSSPGCSKCSHTKEILRKLVKELGADTIQWRDVNILDEIDHAVQLGVLSTPAISINDELVFTSLPSVSKLRTELLARLVGGNKQ